MSSNGYIFNVLLPVLKHYMKTDVADYSEPATLAKTTSRKRARRTNSMLEAAVLADADDDGNAMDATNGATPALHDDKSPGLDVKSPLFQNQA